MAGVTAGAGVASKTKESNHETPIRSLVRLARPALEFARYGQYSAASRCDGGSADL